jgi:hypothetical protein
MRLAAASPLDRPPVSGWWRRSITFHAASIISALARGDTSSVS